MKKYKLGNFIPTITMFIVYTLGYIFGMLISKFKNI